MHHHFLIASRQLWPNINGLLLLGARGSLPTHIHIIHTSNESESARPAARLKQLAESVVAKGSWCELHQLPEESPQAVTRLIKNHLPAANLDSKITINATGGLKSIFAGLLPFFARREIEVLYTELGGAWLQLQ